MKQNVTISEWTEFEISNPKMASILERYYRDWQQKEIDEMHGTSGLLVTMEWEPIYLWLTIGQMIEYLDDYLSSLGHDWGIYIGKNLYLIESCGYGTRIFCRKNYLCDALWEAVKQVLEK